MSNRPSQADWLAAVHGLQQHGSEYHGPCPCCSGSDRFRVLADGAAFCRQCDASIADLRHAAGLNGSKPIIRRLPLGSAADKVTEYEIRDAAGELQAVHGRRDKLIGKDLWWRLPDGTTGLGGRKTKTLPLYRSQHITGTKATAVCIVEGEKAADALAGAVPNVLALGTITGASSAPDAEVLQPVIDTGLPVYLWPDRDAEGAKHMQRVAALIPAALVIVDAPPDTKGSDAADWARLTDRPSWESLAAAAVAPGEVADDAPAAAWRSGQPNRSEQGLTRRRSATTLRTCTSPVRCGWNVRMQRTTGHAGGSTSRPRSERRCGGMNGHGLMRPVRAGPEAAVGQCRQGIIVVAIPWHHRAKAAAARLTVVSRQPTCSTRSSMIGYVGTALMAGTGVLDLHTGDLFEDQSRTAEQTTRSTMALAMHRALRHTGIHRAYDPGWPSIDETPVLIATWRRMVSVVSSLVVPALLLTGQLQWRKLRLFR